VDSNKLNSGSSRIVHGTGRNIGKWLSHRFVGRITQNKALHNGCIGPDSIILTCVCVCDILCVCVCVCVHVGEIFCVCV